MNRLSLRRFLPSIVSYRAAFTSKSFFFFVEKKK